MKILSDFFPNLYEFPPAQHKRRYLKHCW